ncbi:MAG: acyltransferase family protein, partial [Jatrophihabitans sp.]|uniref:acyltransferase family protein n=1 Tax=Jatrophihabitans sp. TaxID=1932789 RepID=UPI003F7D0732
GGYTLTAVCAAVVVAGVLHGSAARVDVLARAVSLRPLRHLGRISYGLYLWHVPVAVMIGTHGRHWPVLVKFGLLFGVSVVLAEVSMLLVERPFLRWKARFDTRRAPVASDAAPARRELQPAA